jgi:hypothetical protein
MEFSWNVAIHDDGTVTVTTDLRQCTVPECESVQKFYDGKTAGTYIHKYIDSGDTITYRSDSGGSISFEYDHGEYLPIA